MHLEKKIIKYMIYLGIGATIIAGVFFIVMNFSYIYDAVVGFVFRMLDILTPLIWGLIIAFILMPLVKNFEKLLDKAKIGKKVDKYGVKRGNRMAAMILSFILVIAVLGIFLVGIGFIVGGTIGGSVANVSLTNIADTLTTSIDQIKEMLGVLDSKFSELGFQANIASTLEGSVQAIMNSVQSFISSFALSIGNITSGLFKFVFGFIFAANIIINREYFGRLVENFLRLVVPPSKKTDLQGLIVEINGVLGNFVRGQLIDLTFNSIVTGIALMIAGFNSALFLGFFAGFTNIIPYLGSVIGAIPVFVVGTAQGGILYGLFGLAYVLVVQQLYITFITPKIQGDRVGIHPMFILLSVTVCGSLFGIVGMILATPIAGIISIFVRRWALGRASKKNIELLDIEED